MIRKISINLSKIFASVLGLGYMPFAPGTWGAFAGLILWFFIGQTTIKSQIIFLLILFLFSVLVSQLAGKAYKIKDSQHIVIDEFIGFYVAVFALPYTLFWGFLAFILFRIFDIWKPYPIKLLEKLPEGWGVVADDVMAGIYACIILNFFNYIF